MAITTVSRSANVILQLSPLSAVSSLPLGLSALPPRFTGSSALPPGLSVAAQLVSTTGPYPANL
jgi:hypothetical protein